MNKLLLCVTIDFPFKKSCLSEPDASLSNNRGSQTILQTVRDWEWKWARMDTESTDSCPYRMSKNIIQGKQIFRLSSVNLNLLDLLAALKLVQVLLSEHHPFTRYILQQNTYLLLALLQYPHMLLFRLVQIL